MAGLSGIVKKISDLVTGTPADDDCFVFGKSDLKKITLAKLKDALGITSINSSLEYSTGSITQGTPSWENIEGTVWEKNGCHLHIHGIIKSTTQSNIIILNGIESMNIANDISIILPYGTSSKEYIGNYYAKVSQNSNSILLTLPKNVEANTYIGMDFVLELKAEL